MALVSTSLPSTPLHQLDKISELPDDILLKVLSTLDLKNAVKTSVLAKRWRYLWTWLPVLDFDYIILFPNCLGSGSFESDRFEPQRYINWVNQVVYGQRRPHISKFRVFFRSSWGRDMSQLERWALFAFSKRVEDLDLDLDLDVLDSTNTLRFSLGLDVLKHPQNINLKSLRLSYIDISDDVLEFILLHCHLLEQLYVRSSETLHRLNIGSDKLKHLTVIDCIYLIQLQIDAVNLISFRFRDNYKCVSTHMVFKSVPKLVEARFDGTSCKYPFRILEQISHLTKQLTKLSFSPCIDLLHSELHRKFCPPPELFPNVKQLIMSVNYIKPPIAFIKFFLCACPMLRELKILAVNGTRSLREEANLLQEIELEDGENAEITINKNSRPEAHKENVVGLLERNDKKFKSHGNLRVFEVVGFHGCDADVRCVLDTIACASSLETLILNTESTLEMGYTRHWKKVEKISAIKRRARKLVKLVPSNVHVGVVEMPDVFWFS